MIHGLWTGVWYGYAFGSIFVVAAGTLLVVIHRVRRELETDIERIAREQ
jgi:hypothetical protein